MQELEVDEIRRQIATLKWYHTIDLGRGITTPGMYDHRAYLGSYGLPEDLTGKTALDIGASSGFFAFEMEKRGAKVVATDLPEWAGHDFSPAYRLKTPEEYSRPRPDPFELAKGVLGSRVEKRKINIYDISPETVGTFDLVFCGSVLLHLTDPIRALWRVQSVTKDVAIIATGINPQGGGTPDALFFGHYAGDTWWIPNRPGLEAMLEGAGFRGWEWVSTFRLDPRDGRPGMYHGVVRAWNTASRPNILAQEPPCLAVAQAPDTLAGGHAAGERDAEIARLRELVAGYERGRFIRLMKWVHRLRP